MRPIRYETSIIVNPGDSLQAAVNAATSGTVLLINPGTYAPTEIADKSNLSLVATDDGVKILQTNNYTGTCLRIKRSNNIKVEGITVTRGQFGIYMRASTNCLLKDVIADDIWQEGILIRESSTYIKVINPIVRNTKSDSYAEGIYIGTGSYSSEPYPDRTADILISGADVYNINEAEGIDVKGECFRVTIENCRVHDLLCADGGGISFAPPVNYNGQIYMPTTRRNNVVRNCEVFKVRTCTTYMDGNGISVKGVVGVDLIDNYCHNNQHYGLSLSNKELNLNQTVRLSNNRLEGNSAGTIKTYSSPPIEYPPGQVTNLNTEFTA